MEYFYKRPHNSGKAVRDMARRAAAWMLLILLVLPLCLLTACGEDPYAGLPPEAKGRTVIMVGTMLDYGALQMELDEFNKAQDEIWAVLKVYMDRDIDSTMKAALQRTYAELSTGNRPDIYNMVSFDAATLRKAGYLADWYPLMDADPEFHMEDYQTNIWEQLETDGHLYQLCVSFDLYGMEVPGLDPGRTGWTLEEFADWAEEHELTIEQNTLLKMMLWYGTQFEYINLENKTCQFETPAFYEWLAYLRTLPEEVDDEDVTLQAGCIAGPERHESTHRLEDYYPRVVGLPSQNRTGPGISIRDSYALSSDTKHREACWTFARWQLSYERCNTWPNSANGISIRRDVWESQLYRAGLDGDNEESLVYRNYNRWDEDKPYPAMPEEEIEYLRESVANASYVSLGFFDYEDVTAIVEEEVLAYLAGDKTAEDCAHIIQSRVSTMLAEQE